MTYYILLKSNTNKATATKILSEPGSYEVANSIARGWGRGNASLSVSYEVTTSAGDVVGGSTVDVPAPAVKRVVWEPDVSLKIDTAIKFHAILEALQQYVDNSEDADYLIEEEGYAEHLAKAAAVAGFRDQLDAVLASLAD